MDSYKTPLGEIKVRVFGHASLHIEWNGKNIYSDPYSEVVDYVGFPAADLVLVTHNHYDHYDEKALNEILTENTRLVVASDVPEVDGRYTVLNNYDSFTYEGINILAVPSYNINRRNEEGNHFHPKGVGNGYVLDFNGFKVYIAGDTEPVSEMDELKDIDIAFLPKNLPYTMTDEEFIALANRLRPEYLYPIHYFELDEQKLRDNIDSDIKIIVNKK